MNLKVFRDLPVVPRWVVMFVNGQKVAFLNTSLLRGGGGKGGGGLC